jgi:hypothetical protein
VIWKALFEVAAGRLQPDHLMGALHDSLPWDEIASCSKEEKEWFSFGELRL